MAVTGEGCGDESVMRWRWGKEGGEVVVQGGGDTAVEADRPSTHLLTDLPTDCE